MPQRRSGISGGQKNLLFVAGIEVCVTPETSSSWPTHYSNCVNFASHVFSVAKDRIGYDFLFAAPYAVYICHLGASVLSVFRLLFCPQDANSMSHKMLIKFLPYHRRVSLFLLQGSHEEV